MLRSRLSIFLHALACCAGLTLFGGEPPAPVPVPAPDAAVLPKGAEPYEAVTQQQIDAITYEDCEDDDGVTFPFAADFERVTSDEDRKKTFEEWKTKLEEWDCNKEEKIGQKVRNFISLMALIDVMQGEFERESPLVLFNRMKKEIPKEQLIKAAAYCALKPEEGKIIDKSADLGMEDGASEDRVRERVSIYAKKVLGRLLGKLPPKPVEEKK